MYINKSAIEQYLAKHAEKDFTALVTHIIKTTNCTDNCYHAIIENPLYPQTLQLAQKDGSLKNVHSIILNQLDSMRSLRCHENSLRTKRRPT